MKTDPLAIVPVVATLTASTYIGTQISSTQGMITWLVIGACTGACTAICLPIGDADDRRPHAVKRKFFFSLLCGVGLTFCAFAYKEDWVPTADRVFAMSWLAATLAWVCTPLVTPLIRSWAKKWNAPK